MSLDTLLEAARYLEMQEQKQQLTQQELRINNIASQQQQSHHHQQQQHQQDDDDDEEEEHQNEHHHQQQQADEQGQPSSLNNNMLYDAQRRIIHNSFDIINPLVIDEGGEQKRKQPPMVFRSGTREVHNKLEKHRRAHLKECFDILKKQLPQPIDEKKTSNLSILHSALRYIQTLKRKERELDHEMERLAREKIASQQRLATLKKEIAVQFDNVDFNALMPEQSRTTNSEPRRPPPLTAAPVERVAIPPLPKHTVNGIKDNIVSAQQTVPTLSMVPVAGYPMSQSLVLHKVTLVQKGITDISPLTAVPTPVAHYIAAPAQQINGKVVPVVNTQYVMKPVVMVSSSPAVAPRPS